MIKLIRTDSANTDFQNLIVLLDQDLQIRDGDEHTFYAQFNKVDKINNVIVAYSDEKPVGCGAFKNYSAETVEIKRMFVKLENRGQKIAKQILDELESWANELGYSTFILETGIKQPEAIRLYGREGYEIIPNYGQYEGVENSVCMQKSTADKKDERG
jgi:putative acetyltransferase